MPDLLLELFSEEIPARMQARAAEDLRKLVTDRLVEAGLVYEGAKAFATPRRLALTVQGIPSRQPDLKDEKKGPRVGAPEGAIAGFLKAAGLASLDEATIQKDPKKGDFYVALIEKPGRPALDVLAEILPVIVRTFPWPKSMRWGERSARPGALSWVRPLHAIVATFAVEGETPEIVPFAVDGIVAGNVTYGHRFMARQAIEVRRFDDYVAALDKAKVVLDPARRKDIILHDAKDLAFAQGLELVEDQGLADEVAGLVEWPVALMGTFDEAFLGIPDEVIRATIRANQKCFVLRDPDSSKLANKFILVSNIEASDGGRAIIAGNERVIRARLSDAKFFYETDLKNWKEKSVDERLERFKGVTFHAKLGSQYERIERIERLAGELAPLVGADVEKAKRAARLAKLDLATEVVGEFPELQGLMGRYYAEALGEDEAVAHAIEDHYKPQGPNDLVPADPVSIAVALADKIDTLVGFWAIDEKPTGSKDPYALRRAALGVIRGVVDNEIKLALLPVLRAHFLVVHDFIHGETTRFDVARDAEGRVGLSNPREFPFDQSRPPNLLSFFFDRLKVQLREQGARHDLVDAVLALGSLLPSREKVSPKATDEGAGTHPSPGLASLGHPLPHGERESASAQDDLLLIVRRVEALGKFLDTDDGRNLLAGTKRAANILRIEEKKDGRAYSGAPDAKLFALPEEKALAVAIDAAKRDASAAVAKEDFTAAMAALAKLRPAVDAFFDKVTVNADDQSLRENRLKLLNEIRDATRAVADFSKIEG